MNVCILVSSPPLVPAVRLMQNQCQVGIVSMFHYMPSLWPNPDVRSGAEWGESPRAVARVNQVPLRLRQPSLKQRQADRGRHHRDAAESDQVVLEVAEDGAFEVDAFGDGDEVAD